MGRISQRLVCAQFYLKNAIGIQQLDRRLRDSLLPLTCLPLNTLKVAAYFLRFMKSIQLVRLLPLTAVATFFSSCGELPPGVKQQPAPSGWWNDQGGSGSPRIIVHVTEQKAY